MSYAEFLASKSAGVEKIGPTFTPGDVHEYLHEWQRELVTWAATTGRAAIWADTGLGKTLMQLEWARLTADGGTALIVAPLAVCEQTSREARKIGIDARYIRSDDDMGPGIWITNYEMVQHFSASKLDAVVLDEASILKQSDGKTRTMLIKHFAPVRYRLSCTATPAPNDPEELTNQAEFLGVSSRVNMLAAYFIHDSDGWRLKGHARHPLYRWMSSWAVAIRRPSDMGYSDEGYDLPGLNIVPHLLDVDIQPEDQLFATDLGGVGGRAKIRKQTLIPRCEKVIELVDDSHGLSDTRTKLAAWDGSRSTRQTDAQSTNQTRLNENAESPRDVAPSGIANTCGSTTESTKRDSSSTSRRREIGETPTAGEGTQKIQSTEQSASDCRNSGTRNLSGTTGSESSSGSPPTSTTSCSNSRAEGAQSVTQTSETHPASDYQSTTATRPEPSDDSLRMVQPRTREVRRRRRHPCQSRGLSGAD